MEEYNFIESLRPKRDDISRIIKKRNSIAKNTRIPFELDVPFHTAFMTELTLMKIKFPFLTESQVQGRTLDKFCIPNFMGKPYKKHKSGNITLCTIRNAIQSAKKSLSERKFRPSRPQIETKRRHSIDGRYFPIDVAINSIYRGRNAKSSRNLYNNFTLYSDEMDADDYSIHDSSSDDSGLEDFHPENQSQTFGLNFMKKPSAEIQPVKTYEKRKRHVSSRDGISKKANEINSMRSQKTSSKKVESTDIKSLEVCRKKVPSDRLKTDGNESEVNKVPESSQRMITSDYEGDTVESSVDIIDETPSTDERQKKHHLSPQPNAKWPHISESRGTKNKSLDCMSPELQLRRKKVSTSHPPLRNQPRASSKRIKQSISQVTDEYLENVSADGSSSIVDSMDMNPAYLCGVKCLSTPKPHVPLVKVNLSVCSQDKTQESANKKKQSRSSNLVVTSRKHRKCSESVPYIDESSLNSFSGSDSNSEENPMSVIEKEETYPKTPLGSYRERNISCSSVESYTLRGHGRFSPNIIKLHSSQGTLSESSDAEDDVRVATPHCHATNEDFGVLGGNFSPQMANTQLVPRDGSYTSPPITNFQDNNTPNSDGYFLANLFDEYTNQSERRTLRSSERPLPSSQEDDGALVVE